MSVVTVAVVDVPWSNQKSPRVQTQAQHGLSCTHFETGYRQGIANLFDAEQDLGQGKHHKSFALGQMGMHHPAVKKEKASRERCGAVDLSSVHAR